MNCKIFLSSTFKDMQYERDIIQKEILPEVQDYVTKYGINLEIVDLRWGINTENVDGEDVNYKILRTCFDEIDLCKPFFMCLLGNRYGWIPDVTTYNKLINVEENKEKYLKNSSVTEMEIQYALNYYKDDLNSFMFFIRDDIKNLPDNLKELYSSEDDKKAKKITNLKEKIDKEYTDNVLHYNTIYENNELNLESFKRMAINKLKELFDQRFKNVLVPANIIEKQLVQQNSLINKNIVSFSGRKDVLEKVYKFYESDHIACGLFGESGIGKSSIISYLISESFEKEDTKTIYYIPGLLKSKDNIYNLLASILYQLLLISENKEKLEYIDEVYVKEHFDDVINNIYIIINNITKKFKLNIFIDALDQINDFDKGCLCWLNSFILKSNTNYKVNIVLSYIKSRKLDKEIFLKGVNEIKIDLLSDEDIKLITNSILLSHKKRIPNKCYDFLISKTNDEYKCCAHPLYLSLILQVIINIDVEDYKNIYDLERIKQISAEEAIYEYIGNLIKNSPDDFDDLLFYLVENNAKKMSYKTIKLLLATISIPKNGTLEKDILNICKKCNIDISYSDYSYFKKLFRLLFIENDGKINFRHNKLDKVMEKYFFNEEKEYTKKVIVEYSNYLKELENNKFKQEEYLYFLYLEDNIDLFKDYLINNIDNKNVIDSFMELYSLSQQSNEINNFFIKALSMEEKYIKEILKYDQQLFYPLDIGLYLNILESNRQLSIEWVIKIYYKIIEILYNIGKYKVAYNYGKMINKMLKKYKDVDKSLLFNFVGLYSKVLLEVKTIKKVKRFYKFLFDNAIVDDETLKYYQSIYLGIANSEFINIIKNNIFEDESINILEYKNIIESYFVYCLKNNDNDEFEGFLLSLAQITRERLLINENIRNYKNYVVILEFFTRFYLFNNNEVEAKKYILLKSDINDKIYKVTGGIEYLYEQANSIYEKEEIEMTKHQESKKLYRECYKNKYYKLNKGYQKIDNIFKILIISLVSFLLILVSNALVNSLFFISGLLNMKVNMVVSNYLFNSLQVICYIFGMLMTFYLTLILISKNKYLSRIILYKKRTLMFGIIFLVCYILNILFTKNIMNIITIPLYLVCGAPIFAFSLINIIKTKNVNNIFGYDRKEKNILMINVVMFFVTTILLVLGFIYILSKNSILDLVCLILLGVNHIANLITMIIYIRRYRNVKKNI
ncbi:MAG: DUF4062 domain-containing protein [Bacilli bacterium]|nr:DUF4062 domain-containing protein [Bacilli bacterium]